MPLPEAPAVSPGQRLLPKAPAKGSCRRPCRRHLPKTPADCPGRMLRLHVPAEGPCPLLAPSLHGDALFPAAWWPATLIPH
eukprot:294725-Chlamydomonas_euryale.AAC.1